MRPSKHDYYLDIAEQVALRSTCVRRNFGAVIVKQDQIIATGYGGAPRGTANCCDVGPCYRGLLGARSGEHYEFCRAVHAEQNAIIEAPRLELLGSVLYLVGLDAKTKERLLNAEPCRMCKRVIVNAGIRQVIARCGERGITKHSVKEWVRNHLWELKKTGGRLVPIRPPRTIGEPVDEERASRLRARYSLGDAIVVQVCSYEKAKHAVGRVAARYFVENVRSGMSVALSCGDTILRMLEYLPYQEDLRLSINQLSIEGDPTMIHQAPATLVGLLRSKSSARSKVRGLQLPARELLVSSSLVRRELLKPGLLAELRRKSLRSDYVFLGVGSARRDSASFWAMAQSATGRKFGSLVRQCGIAGEVNNQVYDEDGKDCSALIPGFEKHVVNVVSLSDIRRMAGKAEKHKVVIVATGKSKAKAIRIALSTGLGNVLITGRDDADRLLAD